MRFQLKLVKIFNPFELKRACLPCHPADQTSLMQPHLKEDLDEASLQKQIRQLPARPQDRSNEALRNCEKLDKKR